MIVWDSKQLDLYVEAFKALSDPVRVQLFARIAAAGGEKSCTDLVQEAHVGASTVSYHIKILKSASLVDVRKAGRNYFYTLRWDVCEQLVPGLLKEMGVRRPRRTA